MFMCTSVSGNTVEIFKSIALKTDLFLEFPTLPVLPERALTQGGKTCISRDPTPYCSHPGQKCATGHFSLSLIGAKSVSYTIL